MRENYFRRPCQNIYLRVNNLRMRWMFRWEHDWYFASRYLLPWACQDLDYEQCAEFNNSDFTVSVYGVDPLHYEYLETLSGIKACVNGEGNAPKMRSPSVLTFTCGASRGHNIWAAPTMGIWTAPRSDCKVKKCSVIERGAYNWRNELVNNVMAIVRDVDGFGDYFGKRLPDAHGWDNKKSLGIREYAFSVGIENQFAQDYITEKYNDIILCEAVPVYQGAPNIMDYTIEEAIIGFADVTKINWQRWHQEYAKRRKYVLFQKEVIRSKLNIFRYFIRIAQEPSLLSEYRPIKAA